MTRGEGALRTATQDEEEGTLIPSSPRRGRIEGRPAFPPLVISTGAPEARSGETSCVRVLDPHRHTPPVVMPGLVPGIPLDRGRGMRGGHMDGRNESGHDALGGAALRPSIRPGPGPGLLRMRKMPSSRAAPAGGVSRDGPPPPTSSFRPERPRRGVEKPRARGCEVSPLRRAAHGSGRNDEGAPFGRLLGMRKKEPSSRAAPAGGVSRDRPPFPPPRHFDRSAAGAEWRNLVRAGAPSSPPHPTRRHARTCSGHPARQGARDARRPHGWPERVRP